jgi:hypothetical protein
MIKKKAKRATATKKTAKKKSAKKGKKETNPAGVRKEVSKMVESEAVEMAQAVIDEGKKGQLATMKYLFEMASIYPAQADQDSATAEEDSLAKTLLHRLNIPDRPIKHDEDEEEAAAIAAEKLAGEGVGAEKNSESPEGGETGKNSSVTQESKNL